MNQTITKGLTVSDKAFEVSSSLRLAIIANPASGSANQAVLSALQKKIETHYLVKPIVVPVLESGPASAARNALNQGANLIYVCGGDGTVNGVAQELVGTPATMAVIPTGTFNYFARLLGIAKTAEDAIENIEHSRVATFYPGQINDRFFVNNASLGLYTDLIRAREQHNARWGRMRIVGVISAIWTSLKGSARIPVSVITDGKPVYSGRTSLVFCGVNPQQFADTNAPDLQEASTNSVGLLVFRAFHPWVLLKMLLRMLFSRLEKLDDNITLTAKRLEINSPRSRLKVTLDGEIVSLKPPYLIARAEKHLNVLACVNS